jgi:hypothetical protein
MTISKITATDIAMAHREIEIAEKLLAEIEEALNRRTTPDIRDAFGRRQDGLTLGVPSGENSHRLFNVPYAMARPIIRAHISQQRALIETLSVSALIEASADTRPKGGDSTKIEAPFTSGAVGNAETPNPSPSHTEGGER